MKGLLILLIFGVWGMMGCQPSQEKSADVSPRTTVTFLHYFTDSSRGGMVDIARNFNGQSLHHDLKAVSLDHEAFKTSIQTTLKLGHPPDLYSYWAGARTLSIVDELEPIDDIWQKASLDTQFSPSLASAASQYKGKKYFVPLTQHYVAFFFNKKVFDVYQLKPPRTWDEFLAVCQTLKSKGVTPIALGAKEKWPAQFWFDLLLLRTAPFEFRQKLMAGEAGYDDPKVKAVFTRWANLLEKGYFNAAPNDLAWDIGANEMVYQGTAGMTLMGTWNIGYFTNDAHKWVAGQDFDFFPFPTIDSQLPRVALGPIDGLVLPKRAINREGAKAVMVYLAGVEAQQAISQGSGALAPNTRVPRTFYSDIQQRVLYEIDNSPHFTFNFDLATPPSVAELGLNAFSEFLAFPKASPQIVKKLSSDAAMRFRALKTQP